MQLKLHSRVASGKSRHAERPPLRMLKRITHTISGAPLTPTEDGWAILIAFPFGENYRGPGVCTLRKEAMEQMEDYIKAKGLKNYKRVPEEVSGPHLLYGDRLLPFKSEEDETPTGIVGYVRCRVVVPDEEAMIQEEERRHDDE